jgi:hypothetical protein
MKIISTIAMALLVFAMLIMGSTDAFAQVPEAVEAPVDDVEPRIVVDSEKPVDGVEPRIVVDGEAPVDGDVDSEAPDDGDVDSEAPDIDD